MGMHNSRFDLQRLTAIVRKEMIQRVRELDLRAVGPTDALVSDFAMMLAVNATHSLYDRRNWIPL